MKRHLYTFVAIAAVASIAGAQETTPARTGTHGDSVSAMHRNPHAGPKHKGTKRRYTTTSAGTIDRGGPGFSVHATSRDYVRADDTKGDDLWHREQRMDAKCGKSREHCGRP